MLSCEFERHPGFLHQESGTCVFYGITFDSIIEVSKFLKGVLPGPEYKGETARGVKVLWDPEMDMWYSDGRWWADRMTAVRFGRKAFSK
jgi:hypothetical protein